jgi:hypothetical protein
MESSLLLQLTKADFPGMTHSFNFVIAVAWGSVFLKASIEARSVHTEKVQYRLRMKLVRSSYLTSPGVSSSSFCTRELILKNGMT